MILRPWPRSRNLSDIESLVEANARLDVDRILRWVGERRRQDLRLPANSS